MLLAYKRLAVHSACFCLDMLLPCAHPADFWLAYAGHSFLAAGFMERFMGHNERLKKVHMAANELHDM